MILHVEVQLGTRVAACRAERCNSSETSDVGGGEDEQLCRCLWSACLYQNSRASWGCAECAGAILWLHSIVSDVWLIDTHTTKKVAYQSRNLCRDKK